jgi:hypothetical protein
MRVRSAETCTYCSRAALCPGECLHTRTHATLAMHVDTLLLLARACLAAAGGAWAFPRAGFFSNGRDVTPVRCSEPSEGRCLGWSDSLNAVQCGGGFRQGSLGCGTCEAGWYRPPFGVGCVQCPDVNNTWVLVQLPLAFVGGIVALGLVIFAVLLVVRHFRGGSVISYAKRTAKFVAQVFVAVQVRRRMGARERALVAVESLAARTRACRWW